MHVFYTRKNVKGEIEALHFDLDPDELVQAVIDAGLIPEGMVLRHWHAGMTRVSFQCERQQDNGN